MQRKGLVQGVKQAGELIAVRAGQNAPRLEDPHPGRTPGFLASQQKVQMVLGQATAEEVAARIGPSRAAFYGDYIERGTLYIDPDPFLDPAFKEKQEEGLDLVTKRLQQTVEEFAR